MPVALWVLVEACGVGASFRLVVVGGMHSFRFFIAASSTHCVWVCTISSVAALRSRLLLLEALSVPVVPHFRIFCRARGVFVPF